MKESYKYNNVSFLIKHNSRKKSKEEWLASVKGYCTNIQNPRDGNQDIIELYHAHGESEQYLILLNWT